MNVGRQGIKVTPQRILCSARGAKGGASNDKPAVLCPASRSSMNGRCPVRHRRPARGILPPAVAQRAAVAERQPPARWAPRTPFREGRVSV